MSDLTDLPFSPLAELPSRWWVGYLDAIHLALLERADRVGLRNALINGGFDLWQRGSSAFTATGYTADRWLSTLGAGNTGSVTRQAFTVGQTNVPGEPRYFAQLARTVTGANPTSLAQRIEGVRSQAGQVVVWSFYAKANAACSLNLNYTQSFGTGGAPSANVTATVATLNLTTTWQRFAVSFTVPSIAGNTLGTNGDDYLQYAFELTAAAGNQTIQLANCQAELGSSASSFELLPFGVTLSLAKRYYQKSYNVDVAPGTVSIPGNITTRQGAAAVTGLQTMSANLVVSMRATPTVTWYSPISGTAARIYDDDTATDFTVSGNNMAGENRTGFPAVTVGPGINERLRAHYVAECEL